MALVIKNEGGYVNKATDFGGPTNMGIAWNYNQGILKEMGFTQGEQLKNLTRDQASEIYYRKYWVPSGADKIPDKRLAYVHFETFVLPGPGAAAKCLLALSKNPRDYAGNGQNEALYQRLMHEYSLLRLDYFANHSNKITRSWALQGWDNRVIRVAREALSMQ